MKQNDYYLFTDEKPGGSSTKAVSDESEESDSSEGSTTSSSSGNSHEEDSDDSVLDPNYTPVDVNSRNNQLPDELLELAESDESTVDDRRKVKHSCQTKKQGKKRVAKPEDWHKNKAKRARNSGTSYITSSASRKKFPERKMMPPCTQKCRLKCSTKISEDDRNKIFGDYWSLKDLQRQRDFLLASMVEIKPKYRYVKENTTRNRSHNNAFYFEINKEKIQICKLFFKATLGINDRPIRTVLQKRTMFSGQMITEDQRGKHGKHAKIDDKIKDGVRAHINSIPRIPSHYCRAGSSREYIEGENHWQTCIEIM
ncbi:hypothetical protein NQ314_001156 [Rhamnusium bicolor]|uniref:Uncharacterized protein n=1 Tax=Rhamnusium bicolor TaxID=1586634 RepID=A0AAV8ZTE2_9CUCU|nr:hypothetical protein NQ314_001156 [Rhamnusium bicolor]